jgi:Mesyanzhinovviridae Dda-like helicase
MELAPEQLEAFEAIRAWWNSPAQVFFLGGVAGSGKSTLAERIATELAAGDVLYGAYTGKAAHVMRTKGCTDASTVHSHIYHCSAASKAKLKQFKLDVAELSGELAADGFTDQEIEDHPGVGRLRGLIAEEERNARRPRFVLNEESAVRDHALGILDEVSMLTDEMFSHWCSFERKVLVMGDPFQLPPVGGKGPFATRKPDFMLTQIHRQAANNPVIRLGAEFRSSVYPDFGVYGETRIARQSELPKPELARLILDCDQVIVGKNDSRKAFNRRIRQLHGFKSKYPERGDKVVCLRNNHDNGCMNGALFDVLEAVELFEEDDRMDLLLRPVEGGDEVEVHSHTHHFVGKELKHYASDGADQFDFGWAMTCHKMQGSQCGRAVVFDESYVAGADRYRWLYTATTRVEDAFTLVRPG